MNFSVVLVWARRRFVTLAKLNERFSNAAQAKNTLKEPDSISLTDY